MICVEAPETGFVHVPPEVNTWMSTAEAGVVAAKSDPFQATTWPGVAPPCCNCDREMIFPAAHFVRDESPRLFRAS
jgi:hypothetical protein